MEVSTQLLRHPMRELCPTASLFAADFYTSGIFYGISYSTSRTFNRPELSDGNLNKPQTKAAGETLTWYRLELYTEPGEICKNPRKKNRETGMRLLARVESPSPAFSFRGWRFSWLMEMLIWEIRSFASVGNNWRRKIIFRWIPRARWNSAAKSVENRFPTYPKSSFTYHHISTICIILWEPSVSNAKVRIR